MLRVLMVLEDYGELMFLQTVLKKIGFDVDAIQSPRAFQDSVLGMNPDVLVMTAHGKRVNGLELNRGLRRVRGMPRAILLRSPNVPQEQDPLVSGWLNTPVAAVDLLNMIADTCGLDKQLLQDKFSKLKLKEIEEKTRELKVHEVDDRTLERSEQSSGNFGTWQASTLSSKDRQERYKKFLSEAPPKEHGFAIKDVQEKIRDLRKSENPADLEALEQERKAFVRHLFKKDSN